MQTHEIRKRFLDHFVKAGHTEVPSASVILDDPNLLFVNAGMVQFVPYFLGQRTPPYATATSIQKCIRTPDIDEVGITTRHNTFFQMAGNFSFGDYFKRRAIELAWTLLTNPVAEGGYGFDPERLWATVYLDDDEAIELWQEVAGPAGGAHPAPRHGRQLLVDGHPRPVRPVVGDLLRPRSRIRRRRAARSPTRTATSRSGISCSCRTSAATGPSRRATRSSARCRARTSTPAWASSGWRSCCRACDNVYETDLLRPVIDTVAAVAPRGYDAGNHEDDVRYRIIADHSRTAAILIGDGVSPGNDGRGYVLRRLLRRVIRSAKLLGIDDPIVGDLMATVRDAMGPSYPELVTDFDRIQRIAVAEETAFNRTLASGSRLFEDAARATKASGATVLSGTDAFTLHDTYGFPLELTLEMAAESGLSVDEEGFRGLMAEQRQRAKADAAARKQAHADLSEYRELVDAGPTEFTGFDELTSEAKILGIFVDGKRVPVVSHNGGLGGSAAGAAPRPDRIELILDRTPFYAESGGQIADEGTITGDRRVGLGQGRRQRRAEDRQNAVGAPRQRRVRRVRRGRHRRRRRRSRAGGTARRRVIRAPTWCTPRCDKCWAPTPFRPAH